MALTDEEWAIVAHVAAGKIASDNYAGEEAEEDSSLVGVEADFRAGDGTGYTVIVVVKVVPHPPFTKAANDDVYAE